MTAPKKSLFLIAAIPLYFYYCALSVAFSDASYRLSDMICFASFTLSATVILAFKNKIMKAVSLVLFHGALVAAQICLKETSEIAKQLLLVYVLFCLPSLFVMILFEDFRKGKSTNHKNRKHKGKDTSYSVLFFHAVIAVPVMVFIVRLILGKEFIHMRFDGVTMVFLLLLVFVLLYYLVVRHKRKTNTNANVYSIMLMGIALTDILVYTFWANFYVRDGVYIAFPLVLAMIIVFDEYPILERHKGH